MLKITSTCSVRFGVLESVECKPVTFSCSGDWAGEMNRPQEHAAFPIPALQFPPAQHTTNGEHTKEPVFVRCFANTAVLKPKIDGELQPKNRGRGDATPRKEQEAVQCHG